MFTSFLKTNSRKLGLGIAAGTVGGAAVYWLWNRYTTREKDIASKENRTFVKTALSDAYSKMDYHAQCRTLWLLAKSHLEDQDYISGAKLLNSALSIYQNYIKDSNEAKTDKFDEELLEQLKQIEVRFIREQLHIPYHSQFPENYGINLTHKEKLINLRSVVKQRLLSLETLKDLERVEAIKSLFSFISQQTTKLLHDMVQDCIFLMKKAPLCNYAFVGTGSLAREEMTPYSDIEYFILIDDDQEVNKQYFRNLNQLLELKIINLGETDIVKGQDLLPLGMLNPVLKGFSLDVHKTPSNKSHSLIGTPEEIANHQFIFISESENHLSSSLVNAILITGQQDLVNNYQKRIDEIHQSIEKPSKYRTLGVSRALSILSEDIENFKPKLQLEDEGRLFEVKNDFYRLVQTVVDALSLYKCLKSHSTCDRIDELCESNFISIEASKRLKQVVCLANEWRVRTYCHYGRQREFVDVLLRLSETASVSPPSSSTYYGLTANDILTLTEAYKTLIPFHKCAVKFYESKGTENPFINNILYDSSLLTLGTISTHLCQYQQAKDYFQEGLTQAKNNNDHTMIAEYLHKLSLVNLILGNVKDAVEYSQQELTINEKNDPESLETAESLDNLGASFLGMGNNEKAINCFERTLKIYIRLYDSEHPKVATVLNNLGFAWYRSGDNIKAFEYRESALKIVIEKYKPEHPNVASGFNHMGEAYRHRGNFTKALECYEHALAINIKIYGSEHPSIAESFGNLGITFRELGNLPKAMEYQKKALYINTKIYGVDHPIVAIRWSELGKIWEELGDAKEALICHEKSLTINMKLYGNVHMDVATSLNNLAGAWDLMGDLAKAEIYFKQALEISKKISVEVYHPHIIRNLNNLGYINQKKGNYGEAINYLSEALALSIKAHGNQHPDVAAIYNTLGMAVEDSGDVKQAIEYYEQALKINTIIYGHNHPQIAITLNNLGLALKNSNIERAIEYIQQALEIDTRHYSPEHFKVAKRLSNLGMLYKINGEIEKAIDCFEKALAISIKVYGVEHINVATCYNNLGLAWNVLGNHKKAIDCFEKALAISIEIYGVEHPNVPETLNNLGKTWQELKDESKAFEYYEKALAINSKASKFSNKF